MRAGDGEKRVVAQDILSFSRLVDARRFQFMAVSEWIKLLLHQLRREGFTNLLAKLHTL
jgi:hypothetical protein